MLPARIPRTVVKVPPRKREGDSRAYLDWIKTLPCLFTGSENVDPHHLRRVRNEDGTRIVKGTGQTNEDRWALPVCRAMHEAAHHEMGDDEAWFASLGFDARAICQALWSMRAWEDRDEYARNLIFRARNGARLKTEDWSHKVAQIVKKYAGQA